VVAPQLPHWRRVSMASSGWLGNPTIWAGAAFACAAGMVLLMLAVGLLLARARRRGRCQS
jgi:hypothetical protein